MATSDATLQLVYIQTPVLPHLERIGQYNFSDVIIKCTIFDENLSWRQHVDASVNKMVKPYKNSIPS